MNTNHRKALKQARMRSHDRAMLSELAMRSRNGFDARCATNDWDNRSTCNDGRRLTGETLGNGVTETRTYSTDNLLTGISYGGTGASIGNLSYTWDANKNKTSDGFGGTMSGYGFTAAGTSYDDEDRLTGYARASGTFTQSWNLTKVGDWTSVTTNGTAQNRTHGPTHELLTAGAQNISTDVKGNITLIPANLTPQNAALGLQWDFDNKLRGADLGNNSSVDVNFLYDALRRRVARTGTGGSVVYVQHDQQTIADYPVGGVASTPTNRYVYASYIDEPVVRKAAGAGGTIHYYHRNQQYSITAMTTSTGVVAERYAYTAYGQPTILNASGTVLTSSAVGNRYTYTGREWDETLGLHHFRARWMSPLAGRFLGRDPIGYEDGILLQEYVDSNPLLYIDPSGTSKRCVLAIPGSPGFKGRRESFDFGNYHYFIMTVRQISITSDSAFISASAFGSYKANRWWWKQKSDSISSSDSGYVSCHKDCGGTCKISGAGGQGESRGIGSSGAWFGGYAIDTYAKIAIQQQTDSSITFDIGIKAGALGKFKGGGQGSVGPGSVTFEADYAESASIEDTDPVTFNCVLIDELDVLIHESQVDNYNNSAQAADDYFFGPNQPNQVSG